MSTYSKLSIRIYHIQLTTISLIIFSTYCDCFDFYCQSVFPCAFCRHLSLVWSTFNSFSNRAGLSIRKCLLSSYLTFPPYLFLSLTYTHSSSHSPQISMFASLGFLPSFLSVAFVWHRFFRHLSGFGKCKQTNFNFRRMFTLDTSALKVIIFGCLLVICLLPHVSSETLFYNTYYSWPM